MQRLIGLTGRAGAGKDTCYELIDEEFSHAYLVQRVGFADLMKESAMAALGLETDQADWFKLHGSLTIKIEGITESRLTGRQYLQNYGSEAHRDLFGSTFWVDRVLDTVPEGITVITDVRFSNEAERIREMGGEVWSVERPRRMSDGSFHVSEQPIDRGLVDRVIHNRGDVEDLRLEILRAWVGCAPSEDNLLATAYEQVTDYTTERSKLIAAELSQDPAPIKKRRLPW